PLASRSSPARSPARSRPPRSPPAAPVSRWRAAARSRTVRAPTGPARTIRTTRRAAPRARTSGCVAISRRSARWGTSPSSPPRISRAAPPRGRAATATDAFHEEAGRRPLHPGAHALDDLREQLTGRSPERQPAERRDLRLVGVHLEQIAAPLLDRDRELRGRIDGRRRARDDHAVGRLALLEALLQYVGG